MDLGDERDCSITSWVLIDDTACELESQGAKAGQAEQVAEGLDGATSRGCRGAPWGRRGRRNVSATTLRIEAMLPCSLLLYLERTGRALHVDVRAGLSRECETALPCGFALLFEKADLARRLGARARLHCFISFCPGQETRRTTHGRNVRFGRNSANNDGAAFREKEEGARLPRAPKVHKLG